MSYLARITQSAPTAIVLLVDRSGSMVEPICWNGTTCTKAEAVATAINTLLSELIARTRRANGYLPYYDIAVLGYSGSEVRSLLPTVGSDHFMTPELLADNPVEVAEVQRTRTLPDGRQVTTLMREKRWVRAAAEWNTPLVAAFHEAHALLRGWCGRHKGQPCYPPTVINITDGEATDGTPEQLAAATQKLRALETADGAVLLLNIHLSGSEAQPILFPSSEEEMPENRYARLLYRISSPMPVLYRDEIALLRGRSSTEIPRGMGFNTNMTDLVRMMNIGTATSTLLL